MDWITKIGYDLLLLDVRDSDGSYYFESELVDRKGYITRASLLAPLLREARARDLDIQATYKIQGEPLDIAEVQEVVAALLDDYDVDGIVEETYTPDYIAGVQEG